MVNKICVSLSQRTYMHSRYIFMILCKYCVVKSIKNFRSKNILVKRSERKMFLVQKFLIDFGTEDLNRFRKIIYLCI